LDNNEFAKLLKIIDPSVDGYIIKFIFEKMDKDKSGELSLDEFKQLILEKDYSNDFKIHPI